MSKKSPKKSEFSWEEFSELAAKLRKENKNDWVVPIELNSFFAYMHQVQKNLEEHEGCKVTFRFNEDGAHYFKVTNIEGEENG